MGWWGGGSAAADAGSLTCQEAQLLLPGCALDALEPSEEVQLGQHVRACESCSRELEALREGAALFALSSPPAEPPGDLRERVLALAAARPRPAPAAARTISTRGSGSTLKLAYSVLAAVLLVTGIVLGWSAQLQTQAATLAAQRARYDTVVRVLASPELVTRPLASAVPDLPARGTAYLDPSSGRGMVMVRGLPPRPAGRDWQVWFVRGEERTSGGLLRVGTDGVAYSIVTVPQELTAFESLGITNEPAGGSPAPTTPRVVGGPL